MATENMQLRDLGTVFRLRVTEDKQPVDIHTATVKKFRFSKKGQPELTFERDADFVSGGGDGRLFYVVVEGDFTVIGEWKVQVYVEMPTGKFHSNIVHFWVLDSLLVPQP